MSDQEQSFKVQDRRSFDEDGNLKQQQEPADPEKAPEDKVEAAPGPEPQPEPRDDKGPEQPLPPVDFPSLVLSLAHAAMMHLGQIPDPQSGQPTPANLPLARHAIDTIGMLKDKTKGNLTDDEQRIMDHVLTDLRLAYVQMNK